MAVRKYELCMGKYKELKEHFSFISEKYEGKSTRYFDMPSESVAKQFKSILDERMAMGAINYCKVIKHRKDPLVEVITQFVYIEDAFEVADQQGNKTWCSNTAGCENTTPKMVTPEELFNDL
jgi:hypothetical protein